MNTSKPRNTQAGSAMAECLMTIVAICCVLIPAVHGFGTSASEMLDKITLGAGGSATSMPITSSAPPSGTHRVDSAPALETPPEQQGEEQGGEAEEMPPSASADISSTAAF